MQGLFFDYSDRLLGRFVKSQDIAQDYLARLLGTRMLSGEKEGADAEEVARRLTRGYADHGFCINVDEAASIGLEVEELTGNELDIVWEIHTLNAEKRELEKKMKGEELLEIIKQLPAELLEQLGESRGEADVKDGSPAGRRLADAD